MIMITLMMLLTWILLHETPSIRYSALVPREILADISFLADPRGPVLIGSKSPESFSC